MAEIIKLKKEGKLTESCEKKTIPIAFGIWPQPLELLMKKRMMGVGFLR